MNKLQKMIKEKQDRENDPKHKLRREQATSKSFHPDIVSKWPKERYFEEDSKVKLTFNWVNNRNPGS